MSIQYAPYRKGVAVTTSDATVIPMTRGLWVGGAGNISVRTASGDTVLLSGVAAGTEIPIAVDMVNATSTTATLIVALY